LAAVAAGFLATAITVAIVIIIRNKDGDKVAEINVPSAGSVHIGNGAEKGDAAVAPKPTVDDAWLKQVAALQADKQLEAVVAKLKQLNPGFDGAFMPKMTPIVDHGEVTFLWFAATGSVTNIAPLRALPRLENLESVEGARKNGAVLRTCRHCGT
jgi:hypothetical protein